MRRRASFDCRKSASVERVCNDELFIEEKKGGANSKNNDDGGADRAIRARARFYPPNQSESEASGRAALARSVSIGTATAATPKNVRRAQNGCGHRRHRCQINTEAA